MAKEYRAVMLTLDENKKPFQKVTEFNQAEMTMLEHQLSVTKSNYLYDGALSNLSKFIASSQPGDYVSLSEIYVIIRTK